MKILIHTFLTPLMLFSAFLNVIGLRAVGVLGRGLGNFLYFVGFRKKIVLDNMELALGKEMSAKEREQLARETYRQIGITFLGIARNFTMDKKQMADEMLIIPSDVQRLEEWKAQGKGGIFISAHTANFELLGMGVASHNYNIAIVVKMMNNPIAQVLIKQRRERSGIQVIYSGGALEKMADAVRRGVLVGFMADQHMGGQRGIRVNFFGTPASSIRGLTKLQRETDCMIVPICGMRREDGRQVLTMLQPLPYIKATEFAENSPERIAREEYLNTQQIQNALEGMLRQDLSQWLWIHRRWKADRTPIDPATVHLEILQKDAADLAKKNAAKKS